MQTEILKMKQIHHNILSSLALTVTIMSAAILPSCASIDNADPYSGSLNTLTVNVVWPEGNESLCREGVTVNIEDINLGHGYTSTTDSGGSVQFRLSNGSYRVTVSDRADEYLFNGSADRVNVVDRDVTLSLNLIGSRSGEIVFKEIYNGGCTAYPQEGTYQYDKYVILHNNSREVQYLDGLCFGVLDPYNSQGTNVWVTEDPETGASVYQDFAPVVQAIWQFGGNGSSFPLQPGEDAVVVICGAIDHTVQYPQSVNLNKEGYFVCYNNVHFPNTAYHPAPGNNISQDRYLNVVLKMGQANAYTFSVFSPAPVIFRAQGTTIQEYVNSGDAIIQKPGSTVDRIAKIPLEWIIDGVDVFYGGSSNNRKRLSPATDAGYVTLSDIYLGHTLHRNVDEESSASLGFEVLMDTNNSSNDFYERTQQSLHE